jgi:phosphoribosylformimino-5-aminoimidazole carboxamide ribotide isomerase
MLFIPAIDLIDGRCVRLAQGDYSQATQYNLDPVETAVMFQDEGARYLHIVDLDAAKDVRTGNRDLIGRIVKAVEIPVQVGGGVRARVDVQRLLDVGVERVVLGTIIVKDGERVMELLSEFDERLVAGIDARDGVVRVSGWTEGSGLSSLELGAKVRDMGFSMIIYTDISRDGMLDGPDVEGIRTMALQTGLPVIAAGGISTAADLNKIKPLEHAGVAGVISGKAVYEGRINVREACDLLQKD